MPASRWGLFGLRKQGIVLPAPVQIFPALPFLSASEDFGKCLAWGLHQSVSEESGAAAMVSVLVSKWKLLEGLSGDLVGYKQSDKCPKWSYPTYNPTYNLLTKSPAPPSRVRGSQGVSLVLARGFELRFSGIRFPIQGFCTSSRLLLSSVWLNCAREAE